jgi:hypothetical protein
VTDATIATTGCPGTCVTTVTSTTANFVNQVYSGAIGSTTISGDRGLSISGPNIVPGATISTVAGNVATLDHAFGTNDSASAQTVSIGGETRTATHRAVSDLTINGATIKSPTANFKETDIGLLVKGTGIPGNDYITNVVSATEATVVTPAAHPAAGIFTAIGLQSATAPVKDGADGAATRLTELVLNPALVPGVPACAQGIYSGQNISGVWNSPSKMYLKAGAKDPIFFNDQGTGILARQLQAQRQLSANPIVGQILFKTSVVEFAAYVVEKSTGQADIMFPFLPTALGVCPGQPIITKFVFNGTFLSSVNAPTGYGKGGLGLRGLAPLDFAGTTPVIGSQPAQAHLQNWTADTIAGGGLTTSLSANTIVWNGGDQGTGLENLIEGQEVNIQCGLNCQAQGLKTTVPYYVHCVDTCVHDDADGIQLSSKPFNIADGVPMTLVDIKTSDPTGVSYNSYDRKPFFPSTIQSDSNVQFLPLNTIDSANCSIVRPPDNTNLTTSFPCPSK